MKHLRYSFLVLLLLQTFTPLLAQQLPQQWLQRFRPTGKGQDRLNKITLDAAGNIYVCGFANGERGTPDAFLMKRNSAGDTLWTYYYDANVINEDYFYSLTVDQNGFVYATGISHPTTNGFADCITVKIDSNGVEQWFARYPSGNLYDTQGNDIAVDGNGNVYVAGFYDPVGAAADWLVIKYNAAGVQQWTDIYNGELNADDRANSITIAPNGNPTVCGTRCDSIANGGWNAFVRQYTPSGSVVWEDVYRHPTFTTLDEALDLAYTSTGELHVAGVTNVNSSTSVEMLGLAYDANGTRLWATTYSDAASLAATSENVYGTDIDQNGNIFFCGSDFQGAFLTCIYGNGNMGWRKKWLGPLTPHRDVFFGVESDNNGHVYTSGKVIWPGTNYSGNGGTDILLITKYTIAGDSLWSYHISDTNDISMGWDIAVQGDRIYTAGFKADTGDFNQNHFVTVLDTSGTMIHEWQYNCKSDGLITRPIVRTDATGNVYVAGTVNLELYQYGYDIGIVKYDPAGTELWTRYYNSYGWNRDSLIAMEIDPNGDLIICAATDSVNTGLKNRAVLIRLTSAGEFTDTVGFITTPIGNTIPKKMLIRADGTIVVAANSTISGGILLFYNTALELQWSALIDSTVINSRVNSLANFPNGDIAIGGYVQSGSFSTAKGVVQRFTPTGARLWSMDIDSTNTFDEVIDIDVSTTGDVAAITTSGTTTSLIRVNGISGAQTWRQTYNPTSTNIEVGEKVRFTPTGNIAFICRGFNSFVYRYITVQYNGLGTLQWANVYSQTALDRDPEDMLVDPQGRVVTGGWMGMGSTVSYDYVMVAYNSSGTQAWLNTWGSVGTTIQQPDYLRSLTRDASGNFIVTGESSTETINNTHFRAVTIKYGSSPVGIEEELSGVTKDNVIAYPNPSASGIYRIADASPNGAMQQCKLIDMQGRILRTIADDPQMLSLEELPSGIYLLTYIRESGYNGALRLVKE